MYRIEYDIPRNHKVRDYDSFLITGGMNNSAVYIKANNYIDAEHGYMYLVFPEGQSHLKFLITFVKEDYTFDALMGEGYDNCYNVDVTDFAPTVKICPKEWSR